MISMYWRWAFLMFLIEIVAQRKTDYPAIDGLIVELVRVLEHLPI
jgi:hypothetical protein